MWGKILSAMRVGGLVAMVGALGWTVLQPSARAAQPSEWVQLRGELPALSLDKTPFAGQPADTSAFTLHDTARSDWIQAGSMTARAPNLVVMIQRRQTAYTNRTGLVRDLKGMSELQSLPVVFRNRYHELTTRFGPLRAVTFEVNADGIRKFCTGYHVSGSSRLMIKGYLCAESEADATPRATACLVDGIRFVREDDDSAALALVSGPRGTACGAMPLDPLAAPATAPRPEGGI